ncbi:MAG TPA: MMPL family transporter [Pirellulales bacterium]
MMKRDFYVRYSPAILLVVVFLLPISFAGARRALRSNQNRVEQWLPDQYEETRVYKQFRKHFQGEEFVLVSWDGCTLDDQRIPLLAAKLVPPEDSDLPDEERYFSKVTSGPSVIDILTSPPINLSREEAVSRLEGSLIGLRDETDEEGTEKTCMLLTLSDVGKKHLRKTIDKIYSVTSNECAIPREKLHMGGPPSDNVAIDYAGEQSLFRLAGLAAFIGLVISWWCLRSVKLVAIVLSAGVFSAMASLAVVWYSGGEMNAIVLTMPSLVYVAAISGAIHLANYYRDSIREEGLAGAPGRAIGHAWLPLTLATGTTAVGLLTLCYSELVPIQLFGVYSAIGVIVSVLFLFFFMPAAFETWPLTEQTTEQAEAAHGGGGADSFWVKAGHWILDHNGLMTAGGMAVIGICAYGMTRMETSVQLMRLFSPKAKVVTDYEWLEENLGPLIPMEIVLNIDPERSGLTFLERMELVDRVQKSLTPEHIPEVGSSLSAVTFAASLKTESRGRPSLLERTIGLKDRDRTARSVRNKKLLDHRDKILEGDYLKEQNGVEMWRISARVSALKDVDYAKFVSEIRGMVDPIVEDALVKVEARKAVEGEGTSEDADGESVTATSKVAADDEEKPAISATYTGLVPLVYKAQNSLLDGLVMGFITDLVLIVIAIIIAMRGLTAGLILAIPSVFPPVVTFGLMGWMGIVVDIGTVMTPSVALGVSVDDIVHFMLRYRRALATGLDRKAAVMDAYHHCGRAMYQSWGVIGLGLSVFALSPFTPTQRFGCMMIALLTTTLMANLLLLPALLAGPLGKIFALGVKVQKPAGEPAMSTAAPIGPAHSAPRATAPAPMAYRGHGDPPPQTPRRSVRS